MSLFTNGFEEGDFSAYTATEGNPTVTTSPLHHGTYAMQAILQAETAPVYCRANKNITSTPAVYMRCYARMEDLFTGSGIKGIGPRLYYSTGTTLAYVIVDCTDNKWGIRNVVNSTNYYESTTSTINPDQWYCLELYMSASSTNGELKLWVDGTLKVNQTGINTGSNNITGASVNSYSQNAEPYARTLYFDCIVVDDSYIGMESGGTASKLAYTTGAAQTVTVGSVSNVITVQVQDQSGNPVTTGATVSLSSSSAGGSFYSDSAGTNQITSRVIPSGQSSTSYYYKDTNTGNPILTASATGLTSATTQFTISSSSGDFSIAGNLTVNGAINTGVIPQTQNNGTARMGHLNQQDANGSLRVQLGSGSNQFFSVNNQGLTSDLLYITNNGKVATSANGADRNVLDDGSGNMILTGAYKSIISSSTPGPHSAAGLKVDLWPDAHSDGIGMQNGGMWLKYGGIFDIYYDSGTTMNSMLHLDSTGILTINKIEMTCTAPYFSTWQGGSTPLEPYLWGLQYYGGQWHWTADGNTLQLGDSFIRFKDTAYPNNTVDIGIIRGPQEPEDPILWISRHLAVKKDFICGGAATVSQGALVLGSDWDATKLTGRMPQIYLAHSEGSPYPEDPTRDTLQIWRAGYVGFGNLSAGLIQGGCTKVVDAYGNTIGFAGSGDAFKVGDECYLVDINYANRIGIQGAQNRDEGGFRLGNNGPWLYRNGGYLRTDSPFISDYSITSSSLSGSGNRSVGANSTGTLIIYPSSLQYKENVEDLEDSSWIYGLRPVSFNYKDKVQYGREKNVGLIAEEVASLNPLFTCTDKDGKPDGVHYEWLSIPIIAELRKLRAEVDGLKTKVS